jgi:predicted metalloprotease
MTFNDDARIDTSKTTRSGRRTGLAVGGGGGLLVVGLFILSQFLGVDLTGLAPQGEPAPQETVAGCETGAEANENIQCRMVAAADVIDTYWADAAAELGVTYSTPGFNLFEGATDTGCGGATSAVGPFYCPADQSIYIDTAFFRDLEERFGASAGPLAQMYVVAHEWGHHMQTISGISNGLDMSDTGPGSDSVRLEIQADCFAGAWVAAAPEQKDADGNPFLEPITSAQISDALSAAAAVGDDNIQETTSGQVQPETWTHGSSEQRQDWFNRGHEGGPNACNAFELNEDEL